MNKSIFAIVLLASIHVSAQNKMPVLKIGDTVPDTEFKNTRNYPGGSLKISDLKGKFTILDFWSTRCSACIAGFPKMQSLQQYFKNDLNVILITNSTPSEIFKLLKNSVITRNTNLPMVLGDTVLYEKMFAHSGDPFEVWLDQNNRVVATTTGAYATQKNVQDLIDGKPLNLLQRVDAEDSKYNDVINEHISILDMNSKEYVKNLCYYFSRQKLSEITGAVDSVLAKKGAGNSCYSLFASPLQGINFLFKNPLVLMDSSGKEIGFRLVNLPLFEFFRFAYGYSVAEEANKIIIDKGVPLIPLPDKREDVGEWQDKTSLCYEVKLINYSYENAMAALREDLSRFFGITAQIEPRALRCLILFRNSNKDLLEYSGKGDSYLNENTKSDSGIIFKNMSADAIIVEFKLANYRADDPVFIDGTNLPETTKINMILKVDDLHDSPALRKELDKYGLGLKEEIRDLDVLVVKKIN